MKPPIFEHVIKAVAVIHCQRNKMMCMCVCVEERQREFTRLRQNEIASEKLLLNENKL